MPGRQRVARTIRREPAKNGFVYRHGSRRITSRSELARLAALAVPPAWTDVEIAVSRRAKVQAKGRDAAGRIQRIYNTAYRSRRDHEKFERMARFGHALPRLRARVDRDLRRRTLSRSRVVAGVVRLIDEELFRVGNTEYATHGSYGITTLTEDHVRANSTSVHVAFVGKGGKEQAADVKDPRLARLIARLEELPGPDVFQFVDERGREHAVRSRDVNAYIKRHLGADFTAKDFRTWGGTTIALSVLLDTPADAFRTARSRARSVRKAVAAAARQLGNTPAVTRSSYVDPRVFELAENTDQLEHLRDHRQRIRAAKYLTVDERVTLTLLDGP